MATCSRSSSTSSSCSASSTRPALKLTTQNLDAVSSPKSNTRYYAHLLYVDTPQRERIMSRANSSSNSSVRSQISTRAASDVSSHTSAPSQPPVTPSTKFVLSPIITTPTYMDEHYPLITTTNPSSIPAHIPRSHTCFLAARHMAEIHNLFIRALNSIYNHCLVVEPTAASAGPFLHFCRVFCSILNHHHEIEDTILFPVFEQLLNEPGAMGVNVDGHDAFLPGLHLFEAYVSKTKPEEYCGMTLCNMLERFAGDLVQHLHEEIPTLLDLWRVEDVKGLEKVWAEAEEEGSKGGSVWEAPAFVLGNVDKEMVMDGELCKFPPLPMGLGFAVRKVFSRRYRDVWGFCAFDWEGRRRTVKRMES
ncbi:uncharacterized protein AB675_7918 [Cyphellophora attinorum]|uniref:Hemerythrin-like domain-containing protein n=1 Tax=Cyphellophora attinorum TaxID=1664694 RepID=A0A0N1H5J8_9EURO|nr:uncharacterized protein AB675_7918 [Phialophora attinorum]KPI41035.1 hypothetical protein AB675_7918 [Phialophora attinorum]